MKKLLSLSALALLCAACVNGSSPSSSLRNQLGNPLFAEQYWSDLTDRMVTVQINEIEDLKKKHKDALVDETRADALRKAQESSAKVRSGFLGTLVDVHETVQGHVLLLNDVLYIGPDFLTAPGPSLHAYLTPAIDPRELKFPDPSSLDLGEVSPYGTQQFAVKNDQKQVYRSFVLYDKTLDRIYAFAQLQKTQ